MKKLVFLIAITGLIFTSCTKEDPIQPIVNTPVTTTTTSGNYGSQLQLYVIVEKSFSTNQPFCDVDSLFNSIMINGVEMVDSLKPDNRPNFVVGGMGFNQPYLHTLTFTPPIPFGNTIFQLDIDVDISVNGRTFVHMVVMPPAILGSNIGDYTIPCAGLYTYDVVYSGNDDWSVTNPCQ